MVSPDLRNRLNPSQAAAKECVRLENLARTTAARVEAAMATPLAAARAQLAIERHAGEAQVAERVLMTARPFPRLISQPKPQFAPRL